MSDIEASSPAQNTIPEMMETPPGQVEPGERVTGRINSALGWVMLAGAGVAYSAASRWGWTERVSAGQLPYSEQMASALNNLDTVLAYSGAVGMGTALLAVGGTKIAARRSPRAQVVDELSGRELTPDGPRSTETLRSRFPVAAVPAVAAAMASMFVGIGYEIENGPSRPVRAAAAYFPGGEQTQLVVENTEVMPMVQSDLTPGLVGRVVAESSRRGVTAMPFTQHLITYKKGDRERTALAIGLPVPAGSPLDWTPDGRGCTDIPVAIDKISGAHLGDRVSVHGVDATLVRLTEGQSATNRLGAVYDVEAGQDCIQKNPNSYGVALDTDPATAADILAIANHQSPEAAATITFDQYVENSRSFWEKNVKPLTNLITALATGLAFVSISREMSMRLLRTRSELASIMVSSSPRIIQAIETIRTCKKNINAAMVGAVTSVPAISVVSSVVFGTQPGIGIKEALTGAGTVFVASLASLARKVFRTKSLVRTLNPAESLR